MRTVKELSNNKNYILMLNTEDTVSDLLSPSISANKSSVPSSESKRMKGICMNIKEKSDSSKRSLHMKKYKEISINSKCINNNMFKKGIPIQLESLVLTY